MDSATHFEREYPKGEAERGSLVIVSEIGDVVCGHITLAVEEQKMKRGGSTFGEAIARLIRFRSPLM